MAEERMMKWINIGLFLCTLGASAQTYKENIDLGNDLYKDGEYASAEAAYRNAMYEESERFESRFNLGNALFRQEQYDAAINAYREASFRTTNPIEQANAFFNMGDAYLKKDDKVQALEAFKQALIRNPKHLAARHNLAKLVRELNNADQNQSDQNQQDQENSDQNENQEDQQQSGDQQDQQQQGGQNSESQDQQSQNQQSQSQDQGESQSDEHGDQQGENSGEGQRDNRPENDKPKGDNPDDTPRDQPMQETEGTNAKKNENQERRGEDQMGERENSADTENKPEQGATPQAGEINPDQSGNEEANGGGTGMVQVQLSQEELQNLLDQASKQEAETRRRVMRKTAPSQETESEKDW